MERYCFIFLEGGRFSFGENIATGGTGFLGYF